jgi:hypothetical protein
MRAQVSTITHPLAQHFTQLRVVHGVEKFLDIRLQYPAASQRMRFARAAIRSSFVETVVRLGVPPIFPPHGSMTRQRLPSVGSLGRLSPLHRYYALLRPLVTRLDSPWFPLLPRYRPKKNLLPGVPRSPRFLGNPLHLCHALRPRPVFVPSHEDEPLRGVAVSDDFRPRLSSLPVPQSALSRCLAASWHVDAAPALVNDEGSSGYFLSGLNHAASVLAVYASQHASRRTTQDSLAAGGQPLLRGIGYPPGYVRGFNSCFLLGQACLAQ